MSTALSVPLDSCYIIKPRIARLAKRTGARRSKSVQWRSRLVAIFGRQQPSGETPWRDGDSYGVRPHARPNAPDPRDKWALATQHRRCSPSRQLIGSLLARLTGFSSDTVTNSCVCLRTSTCSLRGWACTRPDTAAEETQNNSATCGVFKKSP